MEWLLALICMIPAAVTDLKYRSVSLESCVAALLVGCAAFVWWALAAPLADVIPAAVITGAVAATALIGHRVTKAGEGDWWFVAGACAAVSTLGLTAPVWMLVAGLGSLGACHVIMCATRPGLPFPLRLYRHVKRGGDRFRLHPDSGEVAGQEDSGMIVKPALPLVMFVVPAAIITGVLFSL